jgi:hypothetical protein
MRGTVRLALSQNPLPPPASDFSGRLSDFFTFIFVMRVQKSG